MNTVLSRVFLTFCVVALVRGTLTVPTQKQALVELFTQTGYSSQLAWDIDTDPCISFWVGVTCVVQGGSYHVSQLNLDGKGLVGTLPDLSALADLQIL
jgi:hypothetical protein